MTQRKILLPVLFQNTSKRFSTSSRAAKHGTRNTASFTLIINFPAKTDKAKGQGQGNQPPLKKRASGVLACQHKDKKQNASSDVRLADHPKPKKKKTPSRVAWDRKRRREFWKRMKVARQLRAENLAAHFARLQETRTVASPQSTAVSHSENSKCRVDRNSPESRRIASPQSTVARHSEESGCLDRTPLVSESHSRLTIETIGSIKRTGCRGGRNRQISES